MLELLLAVVELLLNVLDLVVLLLRTPLVLAVVLLLRYLGDVPLVFTLDRPLSVLTELLARELLL